MILRIIYDKNEFQDYDLGEFNNDKCKILTSVFPICEINIIYLHDINDDTSHFDKVAKEIQSSKPFILATEVQLLNKNKIVFENKMKVWEKNV